MRSKERRVVEEIDYVFANSFVRRLRPAHVEAENGQSAGVEELPKIGGSSSDSVGDTLGDSLRSIKVEVVAREIDSVWGYAKSGGAETG